MALDSIKRDADAAAAAARDVSPEARTMYRVVLEGVRLETETPESFAIKFSVLSKSPLPKVKNMLKRLPAAVWSGQGASRAQKLVALIEEAGGKARIEEEAAAPVSAAKPETKQADAPRTCTQCGFPLKEGDRYCGFCMSPVDGSIKKSPPAKAKRREYAVPPYRLLCYVIILLAGIIISFLSR